MLRKVVIWTAAILLLLVSALFIIGFMLHKKAPEGYDKLQAQEWADRIEQRIDKTAWDTTRYVSWSLAGVHRYLWDKRSNRVLVSWDDIEVLLYPDQLDGQATDKGKQVVGKEKDDLIQKAWNFYANDGFWLYAPFKLRDPNTRIQMAQSKDGREGLLVTYLEGGVTPGDQFLWFVNEEFLPVSFQVWANVIPIGGVEFTWEDWKQISSGAWLPQKHSVISQGFEMLDVKGGSSFEDLGLSIDPFQLFEQQLTE